MRPIRFAFLAAVFSAISLASIAQQTYWQQEVNHTISVTLNDQTHELTAQQTMEYVNNSPQELTFIWMHLWPNAYKDNSSALVKQQVRNNNKKLYFAKKEERGYIDGLDFKINGQPARLEQHPEFNDVAKLHLNQPLKPGQRITITTPFHVKLPSDFSRLGHEGQSYQITQWYPKPAVFDHKGWHEMPYLDQGEFYSEFGKFDVSITLPANYVVGATGELQNQSEIDFLNQKAAETAARETFSTDQTFPASSSETKTLRYVQNNVHDFAWFADKRYNVWKGEVELPQSKRKVTTWLMFYGWKAKEWLEEGTKDINDAVYYYSLFVGDYPYAHCTAVDGALSAGGGMEYPMITVTDASAIIHEVGHNWFYGILASNERVHPWMDEGLNTFTDERLQQTRTPGKSGFMGMVGLPEKLQARIGMDKLPPSAVNMVPYQMIASRGLDQALHAHSEHFTSSNYGMIVYLKSMLVFNYLLEYLGEEKFDRGMHLYFERWKFRHPYPEDFKAAMEEGAGENLDWFFRDILGSTKEIDVKLTSVTAANQEIKADLKSESGVQAPVPVSLVDKDGKVLVTTWSAPFADRASVSLPVLPEAHAVVVDAEQIVPETDRRDNRMRLNGVLRKHEAPNLNLLAGIDRMDRQKLYLLPVVGWNTTDKWMPGLALYNSSLIQKRVNYLLMPMYSISRSELTGMASINYNAFPQRFAQRVTLGVDAARFVNFEKVQPYLELELTRGIGKQPKQTVNYSYTNINETFAIPSLLAIGDLSAHTLSYRFRETNALRVYGFKLQGRYYLADQLDNEFQLGSEDAAVNLQAEATYTRFYNKKDQVWLRLFGGKNFEDFTQFEMGLSGSPDFLKETIFLDRAMNNSFLKGYEHQTNNRDGGFKAYIPGGFGNYMVTLNFEADIPKTPLRLFADAGITESLTGFTGVYGDLPVYDDVFRYDAGLTLPFGSFLHVYFPVAGSNYELSGKEKTALPEDFEDFRDNIRFMLNLNLLNPFEQLTKALD